MKILLDNHHGIGDVAMFLSVVDAVKKNYPEATVHMLIKSPVEQELVSLFGLVDKFFYYHPLKHNKKDIIKLIFQLRKEHYDISFSHIGTNPSTGALLMKLIGCKKSCGEKVDQSRFKYDVAIPIPKEVIRARRNAVLVKSVGLRDVKEEGLLVDKIIRTSLTDRIRTHFPDKTPVIGLCLGTGETVINGQHINGKQWSETNWYELTKQLIGEGYGVIHLGGKKELESRSFDLNGINQKHLIDLVGTVNLKESLEAISNCDALVAADTGLAFCSALMNIPTISLLGPSDPWLAGPYGKNVKIHYKGIKCAPCYGTERMLKCENRKCMSLITVSDILESIKEFIRT